MLKKFKIWWYFHMANPVVRKGEKGGFKWVFRRFWLEISTVSGNFKAKFMAGEHPYGYLIAGNDDVNIEGFCQTVYMVGMMLTTDQKFVNDVNRAVKKYGDRLYKENPVVEDEVEEKMAVEEVKQVEEQKSMSRRDRRKADRDAEKRFSK